MALSFDQLAVNVAGLSDTVQCFLPEAELALAVGVTVDAQSQLAEMCVWLRFCQLAQNCDCFIDYFKSFFMVS